MNTNRINGLVGIFCAICSLLCFEHFGQAKAEGCSLVLPDYPGNFTTLKLTAYAGRVGNDASHIYSYFTAQVLTGPLPPSPSSMVPFNGQKYAAWCVDVARSITVPNDGVTYVPFSGVLLSSEDPDLNTKLGQDNSGVYHSPSSYQPPEVWKQVNYILNHRGSAFFWDVQEAINRLVGGPRTTHYFTPHETVIQSLIDAAALNAASWQPQCGDVIAVASLARPV